MENTKFANHLVTRFTFENPEKKFKNQNKMQRERKKKKRVSTQVCKET
jgi:hypothetical protein